MMPYSCIAGRYKLALSKIELRRTKSTRSLLYGRSPGPALWIQLRPLKDYSCTKVEARLRNSSYSCIFELFHNPINIFQSKLFCRAYNQDVVQIVEYYQTYFALIASRLFSACTGPHTAQDVYLLPRNYQIKCACCLNLGIGGDSSVQEGFWG